MDADVEILEERRLRLQAERARRLARQVGDAETIAVLDRYADECETAARSFHRRPGLN